MKNDNNIIDLLRRRSVRNKIFSILIPFSLAFYGLLAVFLGVFFPNLFAFGENNKIFLITAVIMSVIGLFMLMTKYLSPNNYLKEEVRQEPSFEIRGLLERFEARAYQMQKEFDSHLSYLTKNIEDNLSKSNNIGLTEPQRTELYNKISTSISDNLTKEFYTNLEKNIKSEIIEDRREKIFSMAKTYDSAIHRLKREIEVLTKRANVNLIYGSIITIAALFLLGYFVVQENFTSDEIVKVSLHFIPRLSLVAFIELFSFFFLKLYRTSLNEIKYYQNELTNIELKQIGLLAATNFGKEEDISNVIKDLSCIERNFKLTKGESTVELEKTKLEGKNLKDVLKSSIDALGRKN